MTKITKALILAAGNGERMIPRTLITPKPLLLVGGTPIIEHAMNALSNVGIKDIFIVVNYKKEMIKKYFDNGSKFNVNIHYLTQDNPKGGTGDAVNTARGIINESFITLNGDVIFDHDIPRKMIDNYKDDGLLVCKQVPNPQDYGIIEINGNHVMKIVEKPENPSTNLANLGMYVMPEEIFDAISMTSLSKRKEIEITDSIQILINENKKFSFLKTNSFWMDIGTISNHDKANRIYRNQ
jgi:bifunctional UDP-N-acetylglucosamine pyrophosphorylase/glucosamine-1-phosphate N-acetyltransferase